MARTGRQIFAARRVAEGDGDRPRRLIGFDPPTRAVRPRSGLALGGVVVAIVAAAAITLSVELDRVGAELRRVETAATAARDAAQLAAQHARAAERVAKSGPSALPPVAPPPPLAERAFVAVGRIAAWRQGGGWHTAVVARNDGDTPTRDLRYATASGPTAPVPAEGLLLDIATPGFAEAAIAGHDALDLPGPALTRRDAGRTLYLHGRVYYKDVLSDALHVTQYCWWTHLPRDFGRRGPAPRFTPCVHFNCADRECYVGGAG